MILGKSKPDAKTKQDAKSKSETKPKSETKTKSYAEIQKSNLSYFYNSSLIQSAAEGLIVPFLPLFAFRLRATNVMIGLLKALPEFASLFMQIIWSKLAEAIERNKWLVVAGGVAWALMWIPIASTQAVERLIFLVTLQSVLAAMTIPAWTVLLIRNSPHYKRGEIAGSLNRYAGIGTFVGNIVAGLVLNAYGFTAFLFYTIAFLSIVSRLLFLPMRGEMRQSKSMQLEAKKMLDIHLPRIKFKENRKMLDLAMAIAVLRFAVLLPSPFFAIYTVSALGGTNLDVAAIAAIGTVASIVFYRSWGTMIDYLGRKTILVSCLLPIVFIPFVYAMANHIAWIYIYTIIGDISWAGFNLAEFAYLSDIVPERRMSSYIAYYNLITGLSMAVAPFIGGIIAQLTSIWTVLIISTIGRISSVYFFDRLEEKTGIRPEGILTFRSESFGIAERLDTFAMTYSMAMDGVKKEINGKALLSIRRLLQYRKSN